MADPEPQPGLSFPTDPQEFDSDERISFSRLDNKFIGVLDDGSEFEWDPQLKRWVASIDEELMAQQQSAYGGSRGGASDDNSSATNNHANRKRKNGSAEQHANKRQRQNTAIYVTGLPLDVTVDEVHEVFSRKCGVIAEEIDSGRPRIKLYTDDKGNLQGDALIVFFKPQSVDMAIMLLDDTDFRYTASGLSSGRMRVQAADSKYKKTHYDKEGEGDAGNGGRSGTTEHGSSGGNNGAAANDNNNGTHNPITGTGKPRDKARDQDKQKIIKRTQKLDAKLADWDDDDDSPFAAQLETNAPKGRVVILRHMFTLRELEEDPAAMLEIKEDIRDECSKLGTVTNVILYDLEEEGIASVKFKTPEAAAACVDLMDGRAFDGRTVRATIATSKEKYRRSDKDAGDEDDED
ncbi:hypothetical protein GGR55DRAFT_620987 [Xylaria sp. FL0064]|nr:hypothetical protein GGR55DRAFT_620987 [Xylaria sp. FL0064]